MRWSPIIFSGPMVRAILAGTKTVTRRLVTPQPEPNDYGTHDWPSHKARTMVETRDMGSLWRGRARGDGLWVRELWRTWERRSDMVDGVLFAADDAFVPIVNSVAAAEKWVEAHDNGRHGASWRTPIFMPRWASRIDLLIASVRVERLHDITDDDAKAEGVLPFFCEHTNIGRSQRITTGELAADSEHRSNYAVKWDEINGTRALWITNPWIWRVEFARAA